MTMKKIAALLPLIGLLLSATGCRRQESKIERYMREAREVTEQCPMMLDACTQMDSLTYEEYGHHFTYNYTVINVHDSILLNQQTELREQLLQRLVNSPEMRPYMEDLMNFYYIYRSEGKVLLQFSFFPVDYLKKDND